MHRWENICQNVTKKQEKKPVSVRSLAWVHRIIILNLFLSNRKRCNTAVVLDFPAAVQLNELVAFHHTSPPFQKIRL
jgi:hypothetical protein